MKENVCSHKEGRDGKISPSFQLTGAQCENIGKTVAGGLEKQAGARAANTD